MRRFYQRPLCADENGCVTLSGQEARHMTRVLRMEQGDGLVLFDGSGIDYQAEIAAVSEQDVVVRLLERRPSDAELPVLITLYQAVIKHDHLDYAVQKCTELGVSAFVPFLSERCVKRPDTKSAEKLLQRERRIALEAVKQCGRSRVPEVSEVAGFMEAAQAMRQYDGLVLLAYENEEHTTIKTMLNRAGKPGRIAVWVGPEGGFTPQEAQVLAQCGAQSCSLGKSILRSETAGACAAAMIGYHAMGESL